MSYFDIEGYQPQWLSGRRAIATAHGRRLQALVGRHLNRGWLIWDRDDDEWFADGPVLLDFEGEQVELNHQKFADLSITWNTIDPVVQANWSNGDDDDPDVHTFHLSWRHDTCRELAALEGRQLQAVELLEWTGGDIANGMVAVSFIFADDRVTISNGMDENQLEFRAPPAEYRSHQLHN
ncbi:hypothetical protein [Nocardia sp. NBC_01009]|uniref:hypothetical protein n=1 Tax=Nocardia sp. NBC_01009 TaxID=2975996 RepID=UPI003865AC9E|nr:hypothetical protein OHA42_13925 [Nocardia sp. NBC_01009]